MSTDGPTLDLGARGVQLRLAESRLHGPLHPTVAAIPVARVHRVEGAAHAASFFATDNFVQMIADTV